MRKSLLLPFLLALAAPAAAEPALTIYNQNFAVVRDTVPLDLKAESNDVETTVALLERIVSPPLHRAGIHGFTAVAAFARRTPVAACLQHLHGE